ncbi:VCBS repeat-containing protein [Zeaxanthinibacter enoshimensis]|uniref:VCBS repeat protein n=1 Tax=Zeaxanthinibacter enoshimensis TaxID=392009 RepID=A0A4R6TNW0_9FLAO|nr:VCBS repeat-containing protein [Zeaxanthinibacter enoshimensis]TDQ33254.1 VCBS repeat protein [Zeaxanthinibacter enoshimensis]
MIKYIRLIILMGLLLGSCEEKKQKLFTRVEPSISGIDFQNRLEDTPELNILTYLYYYNGGGVAISDFNNDGLKDIYFTANQGSDALYINKGNFKFREVSAAAGLENSTGWTTGVTHVDINDDGLQDLYISKVANYLNLEGHNLLYVNQGMDEKGIPVFREEAALYGLDFSGFSTQAAFFDYDLDNDLDLFLMNHSVYPNRNYGKGSMREVPDPGSGDRLYRNDNGTYTDVSEAAGIFSGKIGYGLGLAISDTNNDGYPDIYIGNDFFENDYFYINQGDGTFKEIISLDDTHLGHTSHFSMGNDIADLDNDGLPEIISLDMLPEDLETFKTSGAEYAYPTYELYLKNGYRPQYMQNTVHQNLGNDRYSEVGQISGLAATDWSWAPLAADYDNDGDKDVFISNGIKGATNDMDFINFIANDNIQKRLSKGMSAEEMEFIKEIPQKKVPNYFFANNGDLQFEDVTEKWVNIAASFSNGSSYADLDNDGDLDLVINNVDAPATLLRNSSEQFPGHSFSKIHLSGPAGNGRGIGAKVYAYAAGKLQVAENYNSRGYLSAVPNELHFGLGKANAPDSLLIVWPGGKFETLRTIPENHTVKVKYENAGGNYYSDRGRTSHRLLSPIPSPLDFTHRESTTLDFNREPLAPVAGSHEGPALAAADINQDGMEDLFICGAKNQASVLYLQDTDGSFRQIQQDLFEAHYLSEDTAALFFDADADGFPDLLVASGGNEFRNGTALKPRLYRNKNGTLEYDDTEFQGIEINASSVSVTDLEGDGDLDVLITSDQVPGNYGKTPEQLLFRNDGTGHFEKVNDKAFAPLQQLGNVKDVHWSDLDGNGYEDLIAVGHWMPVSILMNDGKSLQLQQNNGLSHTAGLWNTIHVADLDRDGDLDLVAGNWGENSRLSASPDQPMRLYRADFDNNGSVESILTYYYRGKETTLASKDELVKQLPHLNKEFLSYADFAKASMEDIFTREKLSRADKKNVHLLSSSVFLNNGDNSFSRQKLPRQAQVSSVHDMILEDFDKDGAIDIFIGGNTLEISTQLGRMDALHGLILFNDKSGRFLISERSGTGLSGPVRDLLRIDIGKRPHYIAGMNNQKPVFLTTDQK